MVNRDEVSRLMSSFMYKHPHKDHSKAFAIGVAAVAVLFFSLPLLVPPCASDQPSVGSIAATTPKIVEGHAYDSLGQPVDGASVSVTMKHSGGGSTTKYYTTVSGGYYMVTFTKDEWNVNDLIDVVATYDSETASSLDNLADSSGLQTIDVYFSVPIPEFSGMSGVIVATGLCASMVLFLSRRR